MTKSTLAIINARLPRQAGLHQVWLQQDSIAQILPMGEVAIAAGDVLDLEGDWLSLGGVDLQINGALGLAFPDLDAENCEKLVPISQFLWDQGVDAFLPTLVTTSLENIHRSLAAIRDVQHHLSAQAAAQNAAQILGVHLEGPFLNPTKRGAHPAEHLRSLTLEEIQQVLADHASQVQVLTLAPELDKTGTVISALKSLGITISLGHSQATAAQAQAAFEQGATMVTHAFNAMPALHHREPGLLGAALTHPGVFCGFIADGQHVSPTMLDLLIRICRGAPASHSEPAGLFLVSDALSPLGLPDGLYPWDQRQIEVMDGTARLLDGTLAGTTRPLLVGVQNLVQWGICGVGEAIALATEAPRRAIGLPGFAVGQPAQLLRWHWESDTRNLTWERLQLQN